LSGFAGPAKPLLVSTSLCLRISSETKSDHHEVNFFISDNWSLESEAELLFRLRELLTLLRPMAKSLALRLELTVTNMSEASFLVNKKAQHAHEINHQKLSIREIEVLGLIMQGFTNNEISEKLFISYETVKSHRKKILEKTGAKNTAALISYYHQTFFEK
jgi:DNA-binding CsgD family transcriptional regulator